MNSAEALRLSGYTARELSSIYRRSEQGYKGIKVLHELTLIPPIVIADILRRQGHTIDFDVREKRHLSNWTEEDYKKFHHMYKDLHYTDEKLSEELNTYIYVITRLRLSLHLPINIQDSKGVLRPLSYIQVLLDQGMLHKDIAKELNISCKRVTAWKQSHQPNLNS